MPPMRVAEFMGHLQERVLSLLPPELRDGMLPRIRSSWFQAHYHSPKVHYEVWLTRKTGRIEIGLHFEGPRDFSYRWLELMAQHAPEIMDGIGPDFEFEEWTPSWTRIHQTVPYDPLSEALAGEVGRRLARVIAVLQPIVEMERGNVPAGLERADAPATGSRPRFRRGQASRRGLRP
ncbi:MAG TPA: hypothetical protein VFP63_05845 [Dehalococcoidia bacterium]|nr:hypothetical protein [Dehalococcoidia bacterium]